MQTQPVATRFKPCLQRAALRRERYDWVIVGNGDESPRATIGFS